MNSRLNQGKVIRTAKRFLGFAGLASLVLFCTGSAWAQSKPVQTESTAARPVATAPETSIGLQTSSATSIADHTIAQNLSARPATPRGQSEGIKVHGHWTIEVKNPDGKVAAHREFENSLTQPIGANLLQNLLLGVYTPQSYTVELLGTNAGQTPANQPAPCLNGTTSFACEIQENVPPTCAPDSQFAVCTLTRSPALGITANGPPGQAITFQGTIPAAQPGYIGAVQLDMTFCQDATTNTQSPVSPLNCSAGTLGAGTIGFTSLTNAFLSTPVQITTAGQTIAVTVAISFQ